MALKNVLSKEFLDMYDSGERVFSDINLQFFDVSGKDLKNLVIRDSRLFIVAFYNCDLSNSKFINCEIVYGSFYGGRLENAIFDKCKMDMMLFENVIMKNAKIINSSLIWSGILGSSMGEVDLTNTTTSKVITDLTQITPKYLEEVMTRIGPVFSSLDISIRAKIQEEMERDAAKFNLQIPNTQESKQAYGTNNTTISQGYGESMRNSVQSIIHAYESTNPYTRKKDKSKESYD